MIRWIADKFGFVERKPKKKISPLVQEALDRANKARADLRKRKAEVQERRLEFADKEINYEEARLEIRQKKLELEKAALDEAISSYDYYDDERDYDDEEEPPKDAISTIIENAPTILQALGIGDINAEPIRLNNRIETETRPHRQEDESNSRSSCDLGQELAKHRGRPKRNRETLKTFEIAKEAKQ